MIFPMLYIDRSQHRIIAFAAANGWGAAQYARAAGIAKTTAYEVLKGGNATKDTLRAMESIIPARFKEPSERRSRRLPAQPEGRAA